MSIADDMKEVELREEVEAQEAATDRLAREAFEQRYDGTFWLRL